MNSKYRDFCPESKICKEICEECKKTSEELGHEINKNYLKSLGRICLCPDCCDR